eukprot:scaffold1529_cov86-Cylindrotheca_fusiformis.AAC.3
MVRKEEYDEGEPTGARSGSCLKLTIILLESTLMRAAMSVYFIALVSRAHSGCLDCKGMGTSWRATGT